MALKLMNRALMRSSRELLDRKLGMGTSSGLLNGGVDMDMHRHAFLVPQRELSSVKASSCYILTGACGSPATANHQQLLQAGQTKALLQANSKRAYAEKHKISRSQHDEESGSDSDSDDEFERSRRRMQKKTSQRGDSEFWRRKIRTLHRILDVNRDGVVSFDDFSLLAKRFTDLGHLTPELSAEFLDVMKQTWEEQFGEIQPYNLVTAEQFLVDFHHRLNDRKMAKRLGRFLPYLFKAVDFDHTGTLDLEQYKLFFRCLGLSDEDAAISFAVIDKNGDGQLSMKEFCHLGRQFFLTEDDTKISKMFWGPLIDH